jgi:hypothetical protein
MSEMTEEAKQVRFQKERRSLDKFLFKTASKFHQRANSLMKEHTRGKQRLKALADEIQKMDFWATS